MEGRAGMAGIVVKDGTDVEVGELFCKTLNNKHLQRFQKFIADITSRLTENLASYAIPVFIRLCKEVDRTGKFK